MLPTPFDSAQAGALLNALLPIGCDAADQVSTAADPMYEMRSTRRYFSTALRLFRDDARGAAAIVFAMLAVPVLGLSLAALDFSRAQGTKAEIQNAADTAAGAGAHMLGLPHSEIEDAVRGYMRSNLPDNRRDLDFILTFAPDDRSLTLKIDTQVPTSILGIVGVTALAVHVESTVERPTIVPDAPAHRGVAPETPGAIAQQLPNVTPRQLQEAEAAARQLLQDIERRGGGVEVEQLLRSLGRLR